MLSHLAELNKLVLKKYHLKTAKQAYENNTPNYFNYFIFILSANR